MMEQDAWFCGLGDMTDFLSPSNRTKLRHAGLYDTANDLISEWHMGHVETLKELLTPTRGRWLFMLEGHHYFEFEDGTTTDTILADYLGAPFMATTAMFNLTLGNGKRSASCPIWAHHGAGSGGVGSALRRLEKVVTHFNARIYMMGHQHKLEAAQVSHIALQEDGSIRDETKTLIATGSFLKGYEVGAGRKTSYAEKGMMMPLAIGGGLITITPQDEGVVDVKVSI